MKYGMSIIELAQEISRQNEAKKDYIVDTRKMRFDADASGAQLSLDNGSGLVMAFGINDIAHDQIGTALGIPSKYYDKMRKDNPSLLADNINSWFQKEPKSRMVRTMTYNDRDQRIARAFLSDKYRRIDNFEIAQTVLPIIADMPDAKIESCDVTEHRMYIKVVNPRLTSEVVPGDIVQSGIIISNSEVGSGSMEIQPLVYRLVCKNGMVVNDASTKKRHVGRANQASEDFSLYTDETLRLDDLALMAKVRDTVKAIAEQTQFERVVSMMRQAKEAEITTHNIPAMVELAGTDFGYTKQEGAGILDYLIKGGDLTLYGMANAVTRAAQDVESYDRSTAMEKIGYDILSMPARKWNKLNVLSAD